MSIRRDSRTSFCVVRITSCSNLRHYPKFFSLGMSFEISPISVLAVTAFGLLVTVTGGVLYLTAAEWRDRRRRERERRGR